MAIGGGEHTETNIRRTLSPADYRQLVLDLRAAERAFKLLEEVAPSLLEDLVLSRQSDLDRDPALDAHAAIERMIAELIVHDEVDDRPGIRRAFRLIHGGAN